MRNSILTLRKWAGDLNVPQPQSATSKRCPQTGLCPQPRSAVFSRSLRVSEVSILRLRNLKNCIQVSRFPDTICLEPETCRCSEGQSQKAFSSEALIFRLSRGGALPRARGDRLHESNTCCVPLGHRSVARSRTACATRRAWGFNQRRDSSVCRGKCCTRPANGPASSVGAGFAG